MTNSSHTWYARCFLHSIYFIRMDETDWNTVFWISYFWLVTIRIYEKYYNYVTNVGTSKFSKTTKFVVFYISVCDVYFSVIIYFFYRNVNKIIARWNIPEVCVIILKQLNGHRTERHDLTWPPRLYYFIL